MRNGRVWVLGANDPEMERIEQLLLECGEAVAYAVDERDERVRAENAYRASVSIRKGKNVDVRTAYLIECDVHLPENVGRVVIDHHRPGDPGYGRPPAEFLTASSVGQVLSKLARWGMVGGVPVRRYADDPEAPIPGTEYPCPGEIRAIPQQGAPFVWAIHSPFGWLYIDEELVLAAAADHCLAAGYQGQCPGVDPEALMQWRNETIASFEGRAVESVIADIEWTRRVLREAPEVVLDTAPGGHCIAARDVRDRVVPELAEAAAREGVAYLATTIDSDRRGVVCGGHTTPQQIAAFREWARSQGLVDYYEDPAKGIAGAYEIVTPAEA